MQSIRLHRRLIASFMTVLLALWQVVQPLQAATYLWDSNTGTAGVQDGAGTWTSGGTIWVNPANGNNIAITVADIALLGGGGTGGAVTLNGNQSSLGLIFGQTVTTGYSLTAGSATTLTLGASGVSVNAGAQPLTLGDPNLSLVLGAAQTWSNRSTSLLTAAGAVDNGGNILTLSGITGVPSTGQYNLTGAITGAGGLTVTNQSTTTLAAASSLSGATLISNGATLTLSGAGTLSSTSGVTLSNGNLTIVNAVGEHGVNRIVDAAGITSNGGVITWTNPNGDNTANWAESLGVLNLAKGQTNIVSTNAVNAARTQMLTFAAGSLTHAAGNTSTLGFAGASLATSTTNNIFVASQGTTASGQIIGPWATFGTTTAAQTDYASYNRTGGTTNTRGIQAANIAASAETTWTTAANAYTLSAATTLTGTRTINALRYTGAAATLTLGTTTFNLASYGVLNGGSGTLTIANGTGGTGGVTTPTGGDNTLFLIAGNAGISLTAPVLDNGTAVNLVKAGAGTVTLAASNTYSGVTTINSGLLVSGTGVTATFNGGSASWLGASSAAATNLVLNGGTLRYAGPTAATTDRLFTLGEAGGTIENSAASNGTLAFAGTGSIAAAGTGDRTLTLLSNGTGAFTFSPVIVDPTGGGKTALITSAASSGVVLLLPSANNTFTGGITIQNRNLQVRTANALGANVVSFGTGTTPVLELRADAATNFGANGASLVMGDNSGGITLSAVNASNAVTHTFGPISIGTATLSLNRGSNLNTNTASSLTTGVVTLTGNPTFGLNAGSGTASYLLNLTGLDDGGVARTITVNGGAAGTGKQYLRFFNNVTSFTAGTNIVYSGGNMGGIRLDTANSFGTATNPGTVTFATSSTVGGVRLLNNTSNTNFTTNWVFGNNNVLVDIGGTSSGQNSKGLITGTLSIGTGTLTLNGAINSNSNTVHSLTMGATTFTGDAILNVANTNGTAIGSLTLGALNDSGVSRAITKTGLATLALNSAATSMTSGTTLTGTSGIIQIGNNTALGSSTLILGDGTTSSQLVVSNTFNLSSLSTVTYAGGYATLTTGAISGPTTGTGTISAPININATTAADTGHFQGGGGILNIVGPIVTGGTSGGEIIIRAGSVGLNNATGNTYTSLRVNAGTTTVGVTNAIPTSANVALAELANAGITLATGTGQTIAAGATWTLGGTGPTLENNVATIATGTSTLTVNGTIANNTGSLATQLITGLVSFGGGTGTFDIDSGHATSDMTVSANLSNGSLVKEGAGILTLSGTKNLTQVTVNNGSVVGGYGTAGVQRITISSSGSLQLVNNAAETLTLSGVTSALNVAGGARMGFELGAPTISDRLTVGAGGSASTTGTITLDFYNLGALAAGTYTLLTAPSGLTAGGTTYNVGSAPLGFNYNIIATDTSVQLVTTAYTPRFWTGSQATTSWSTVNAGPLTNWATNSAGTTNSTDAPSASHTVIFSASNATGPTISTTLDAAFTIDAMQFLAAPTGVTAVNVAAGTGGALTIAPATSSAGLYVDTNAGTATLAAGLPVTVGAPQTWNVVGGGANGSALVMAADVAFSNNVTKSGAGALTLSGTNTGSSTLTLSAGTLNINSAAALGNTTFVINGGTTINNSTGAAITLSTNNALTLNGNFTFTGTQNLNMGTGAISLPTNVSITTTASNLTLGGAISQTGGARALTKLGAGTLTLAGNNTFTGGVNLNAGTLNINNAGALGTGTFSILSGTFDNTSGTAITNANNNDQIWNGNFTFTGTNNLNLGTGGITLGSAAGTSRTVTVSAGTLTVGGGISNGAVGTGIIKTGAGTLVLSGANTHTGTTTVNAGTVNLTGSLTGNGTTSAGTTLAVGTVAGTSILNIAGNITNYHSFNHATATNAVAVINQTGGTVNFTTTSTSDTFNLLNGSGAALVAGAYGYLNLTGGTMNVLGRTQLSRSTGGGVAYIGGTGVLNTPGEWMMIAYGYTGVIGSLTIGPGGKLDRTGASNNLGVYMNQASQYGVFNLAGGDYVSTNRPIVFGNGNGGTGNVGFVNLAGGTFTTGTTITQSVGTSTGQLSYINLAGATLKATAALSNFFPSTVTGQTVITTLYGPIDNVGTSQDFTGGFTLDTNGNAVTLNNPILAPTASGVAQSSLTVNGGSGYVGAPMVQFVGGSLATNGSPASGYAVISGGQVTEIVITAPGSYDVAPTVVLTGGGGTGASVTVGTLVANNTTAGITKNGAGTLTLSNATSTFTGPVVVNAGTLAVTGAGSLANIGTASALGTGNASSTAMNAASLVLNGSIFSSNIGAATTTDRLFTITENGATVNSDNTTAANTLTFTNTNAIAYTGAGARNLTLGGANAVAGQNSFAPLIGNAGSDMVTLNKTGVSTWILTNGSNAYTGGTNLSAGVLSFSNGALGTTGSISFNGSSTLRWNGHNTDISPRLVITSGVTGTIDTDVNNVVFNTAVATTGGTAAVLNKAGTGALTLNAAALHTGGTTLTAGTLNIGHASALGSGTFTVAGTSTIDNTTGAAMTLAGNINQAWNGNFTFTGTNDLNLGTGTVDLNANRTVTVTAGTLTVPGIIGDTTGDFGLTKAGAGTLYLKGVNTFGLDDNVTIQGGTLIVDSAAGLGDATNNIIFSTGPGTLRFTDNASFGAGQYFRATGVASTIEVDAGKVVDIAGGPTSSATNGINTNGGTNGAGASIVKTGLGTLRISGGNGFFDGDGGWVVTQGTLSIAGSNTAVLGDTTVGVSLRLNGGTVSYDTDTPNIVNSVINTFLQASSTLVNNVASPGAGITQSLNGLTVQGNYTLNVQGGSNVTSGTATILAGATTLNGNATFNITDPANGGTTLLTLGAVTGNANGITLTGNGDFTQTGAIASSAATAFTLASGYTGVATLSQTNTYSGATAVNGGTLNFAISGNLGDASATNDINLGGGTLRYTGTGALDLTANRQINLGTGTTSTIEVTSATAVLQATGGVATAGAANLIKTGLGSLNLSGALNLNGGNLTVNGGVVQSGFSASGVAAVSVANAATLNLYDAATLTAAINSLTLAGGSSLGFDLNAPGVNDILNVTGAATIDPLVSLNFNNLGGLGVGTYDLLNVSSGTLNAANFVLGLAPSGFNYSFTTVNSNQTLRLTASTLSFRYWQGDETPGGSSWSTLNGSGPFTSNWATNPGGTTDLGALPGAGDTLVFSTTNATGPAITTTLDGSFMVDSLQFTANPTNVTSVTINQGTGGTLTLSPVSANNGISVASNAGAITIGAPLVAGTSQTWEVIGTGVNGSSLTVLGNVTFTGGVTKTGAGTLTLAGTNSGAGGIHLVGGTLNINSATALGTGAFAIEAGTTFANGSAGTLTLTTNNSQSWNDSFTFGGTQNLNMGTGAVTLGNSLTATVSNTLTLGGGIDDGASTYSLIKAGAGTMVLNGANGYDGLTNLSAGTLTLAGDNSGASGGVSMAASTTLNVNHVSALGTGAFTINGGTLNNGSGGALTLGTNNAQFWNSSFTFTGTNSLNLGTGLVTLGTTPAVTVSANNLTVGGVIDGAFGLTKAGTGTLTLSGLSNNAANNYQGTTTLDAGSVNLTTDASLSGGLTFGSTTAITTAATLTVSGTSATFAGPLLVQNTTASPHVINVATGKTLNLNGSVTIGAATPAAGSAISRLNITGGGTLNMMLAGGVLQVGGSTGATSLNSILDTTGLSSVIINLGSTGTVRVNQPNGTNVSGNQSTFLLPTPVVAAGTPVTTITAANLNVGDNGGNAGSAGQTNVMTLGTGLTTLNVNTINIGNGGRDFGTINFAAGNGTVRLRAADGIGRSAVNIGTGSATTGVGGGTGVTNVLNFTGHDADLLISTLTIGGQNRNTNRTDTVTFDTGIFDATTVIVGDLNGAASGSSNNTFTSVLNLGGGTVIIGTGGLEIARGDTAVTGTDILVGTVNISAGNVTVANNPSFGAAIRISDNTISGLTTTGALNITGGTLAVAGNIIRGSTTGTGTATVTLNGGTLNMSGSNIGSASAIVDFNAQAGTLQNVGQLNGGLGLTKNTTGTLVLEGTNTYTGGTVIVAGVLQVGSGSTTGTLGGGNVTNNATLTVNRSNSYTVSNTISGTGALVQAGSGTTVLTADNTYAGTTTISAGTLQLGDAGTTGSLSPSSAITNNGSLVINRSNAVVQGVDFSGSAVSGSGSFVQAGTGTTTLSAANNYTGITTVSAGALQVGSSGAGQTGTGAVTVMSGGTLLGSGLVRGSSFSAQSGSIIHVGDSTAPGSLGTLAFTPAAATGSFDFQAGSNLLLGISTPNVTDATYGGNTLGSAGYNAWVDSFTGLGGGSHDLLTFDVGTSGTLTFSGNISVNGTAFTPVAGQVFNLIDWNTLISTNFSSFNFGNNYRDGTGDNGSQFDLPDISASGYAWDVSRFATSGSIVVVMIPEPSRLLLLGLALAALFFRRRRSLDQD